MERVELPTQDNASEVLLHHARRVRYWYLAVVINPLYVVGLIGNLLALVVFVVMRRRRRQGSKAKPGSAAGPGGGSEVRPRVARRPSGGQQALGLLVAVSAADASYLAFMLEYTGPAWGLPLLERRSDLACALLFYLRGVAGTSGILLFTAFCCNRLLALSGGPMDGVRGGRLKRRLVASLRHSTRWACLICVTVAALVNVPRLVSFRVDKAGGSVPCRAHHQSQLSTILHMSAHMLFQRLGPALLISLLSLLLLVRLRQCRRLRAPPSRSGESDHCRWRVHRHHLRLTEACLVLGCAYVLFFVPPGIYWCLIYAWDFSRQMSLARLHFHAAVGDMSSVTATLSSAINLPVYLICLADFRSTARDLLLARNGRASPWSSEVSETGVSLELHSVLNEQAESAQ